MKKIVNYILIAILIFVIGFNHAEAVKLGDKFTMDSINMPESHDMWFWNARTQRETQYIEDQYRAKDENGKIYDLVCVDPGIHAPNNSCTLEVTGLASEKVSAEDKKYVYGLAVIMGDKNATYLEMSVAARAFAFKYLNGITGGNPDQAASIVSLANWMEGNGDATLYAKSGDVTVKARTLYGKGLEAARNYTDASGEGNPKVTATVSSSDSSSSAGDNNSNSSNGFNLGSVGDASASTTPETKKLNIIEFKLEDFGEDAYFTYDGYEAATTSNFTVDVKGVSFTRASSADAYTQEIPTGSNIFEIEAFKNEVKENDGKKNLTFYLAIETTASLNEDEESGECGGNVKVNYSYKGSKNFEIMQLGKAKCGETQDFIGLLHDTDSGNNDETISESVEIGKMQCSNDPCQPALCIGDNCEYNKTLPQICEDDAAEVKDRKIEYKFIEAYNNGYYNIKKCLLKGGKDAAGNSYKLVDNTNAAHVADNPYCEIRCKEDYIITLPYKLDTEGGRYFKLSVELKGQQDCYSTEIDHEQFNKDKIEKVKEIVEAYNEWARYYELLHNQRPEDPSNRVSCRRVVCTAGYDNEYNDPNDPWRVTGSHMSSCYQRMVPDPTAPDYPYTLIPETVEISADSFNKTKVTFGQTLPYYSVNVTNEATGQYTIYNDTSQNPDPEYFGYKEDYSESSCDFSPPSTCRLNPYDPYFCHSTRPDKHYENEKPGYESGLASSKDKVERLIEELKELIDEYNSCNGDDNYFSSTAYSKAYQGSSAWKLVYKYDPEIIYSYDEPEPNNPLIKPKWIETVQGLACENGNCDKMFSIDSTINGEFYGDSTVKSIMDEDKELEVNTYCIGDINNNYDCQGEETHTLSDSSYEEKILTLFEFQGSDRDGKFVTKQETFKETKLDYIHKVATAGGTYNTRKVYWTGHDNGNVKISLEKPEGEDSNFTRVPGLPVGANTPQGTYFYILGIDNVGTFYDSGELGRIYGSSTNPMSLSNYLRTNGSNNGPSTATITQNGTSELNKEIKTNEYACTYTVSENTCTDRGGNVHTREECKFGDGEDTDADWDACKKRICSGGGKGGYCVKSAESYYVCLTENYDKETCTPYPNRNAAIAASGENYSCCPNCTVMCIGKCLYLFENDEPNDGKLQVEFRTISPANMNPNSRQLGYNWDSANPSNALLAQKAGNTISEIEQRANPNINAGVDNLEGLTEYALKVKMTPDMVTWIKTYNNDHVDEGSYNNESLRCFDYTTNIGSEEACDEAGYSWQGGKCVMANIFCYSTFIDDLQSNFADQVDAPGRSESLERWSTYQNSSSLPNNGGTSVITNNYWTIYNYSNLDVNGDGMPDIGPSWK